MLDAQGKSRKVAIACQGGGSHTAFTAGVLKRLLRAEELKQYEVVGLSGTSGGAVCALLAWHNLLRGDAAGAAEALAAFWRDNSATAPHEQIVVRVIELARSRFSRSLGTASKLNRDPRFIEELMFHGEARAEEVLAALAFEDAWRSKDPEAVAEFFAEDAELVSSAPFPGRGTYKGRARIRSFVTEYLAEELSMDLTRKQVARNGVAWTVRTGRGDEPANRAEGHVEAQFLEGKIKTLRLGDGTRSG